MHYPLYSVAGLHKKSSFMHWKAATSVLGNGCESQRNHLYRTDCCDRMNGFPLKLLQRQMLLRKKKHDFSTKCMRNKRRSTHPVEFYIRTSSVVSCDGAVGDPVKEFCCSPTDRARDRQRRLYKPVDRFYSYL